MKKYLFVWLLIGSSSKLFAQSPPLERVISVRFANERVETALQVIAERGGFNFSYNPTEIELNRRVTLTANALTVRQVLDELFRGTVAYKERRGYVILQRIALEQKPKDLIINGYVLNNETGERIARASVFERRTLVSSVTDKAGFYRIRLPYNLPNPRLEVRKEQYFGESILVNGRQSVDVRLIPANTETLTTKKPVLETPKEAPVLKVVSTRVSFPDTIPVPKINQPTPVLVASRDTLPDKSITLGERWKRIEKGVVKAFTSAKQAIHVENVTDTLYQPVQVSLLPFVGTNHVLSGNVVNRLSVNIIAGYSLGVEAFEVGGFANLVRRDVNGGQLAGFANLVGRDVRGIQASGFGNAVLRHFDGVQAAGFANLTVGNQRGMQLAGFGNVTGRSFTNGLQAAGFANVTFGDFKGAQISGFANLVGGRLRGLQASPILNVAGVHRRGVQLGLFNYADSTGALPIGLLSFARRGGYRRLEISTDALNLFNLTFKTGVRRFYNILTIGTSFDEPDKPFLTLGYGVGTAQNLGRGWLLNVDYTGNAIIEDNDDFLESNRQFHRVNLGLEKRISRHLALAAGPSLTWLISEPNYLNLERSTGLIRVFPKRNLADGLDLNNWLDFNVSLRIRNL